MCILEMRCLMMIDLGYYINVYDLMRIDLPRPRPKRQVTVIADEDEWLPIIDGSTGVCFQ